MMIAEGAVAMIWAAAALSIYNIAPENLTFPPAQVLANAVAVCCGAVVALVFAAYVLRQTNRKLLMLHTLDREERF